MNSHDHIRHLQKITGGLVLVAEHKKPSIPDLRFYDDVVASKNSFRLAYFINCVFKPTILSEKHRFAEYSLRPGWRHDITIDLEKKVKLPSGKLVKNLNITEREKEQLIKALNKLDFVHWAGPTPHGVHCGIYFSDWMQVAHSRCIIGWFQSELKGTAGYNGPLEVDVPPSVNSNRPSRFLPEFSFFRPFPPFDPAPAIAKNYTVPNLYDSFSPGMKESAAWSLALKCRANMMSDLETAIEVGKPVSWVLNVWKIKQEAFNSFNEDIGHIVGPKTKMGKKALEEDAKFPIYLNAGYSWEVCWQKHMTLAQAIEHVFTNPEYEELLTVLEQAYTEARQRNRTPIKWGDWREWVVADITRCSDKFGKGFPVSKRKNAAIRAALEYTCIHCGRATVQVSEVARRAGNLSRDTVRRAFAQWGLVSQGTGKGAWYTVPPDWLPAPPDLKPIMKLSAVPASPPANPTTQPPPVVAAAPVMELTFEAFWRSLLPTQMTLAMNPCPVDDMALSEITRALEPHFKFHRDWRQLIVRKANESSHNLKDDLLDIVKRCLSLDGHIVHENKFLMEVLRVILGPMAEPYFIWLLNERYVLSVGKLSGSDVFKVAWCDNLLGEARFAWRFIEHCRRGGRFEIYYGEPGTGKTEKLAKALVTAQGRATGGSAQNASADLLTDRIARMGGNQKIKTVYKGYDFYPNDRRKSFNPIKRKLFFIDEFGQVSCDAAGIIALRWKPGSTVLTALGVGQNLPVGAGRIGEDLLDWLTKNPNALPTCVPTPLLENHRLKDQKTSGIVRFFQQVAKGEIPVAGHGIDIIYCAEQSDVIKKVISVAIQIKALCILPTRAAAFNASEGIMASERYDVELDFSDTSYKAGERLIIINASENASKHGLRNGSEVEVAEDVAMSCNPNAKIAVWVKKNRVELELGEVARKHSRTGHSVQGMEHPVVVVGIIPSRPANRRWLFTAVSRSREHCVVVCTKDGLSDCVGKNPQRDTLLPVLLDRALAAFKSLPEPVAVKRKPRKRRDKVTAEENTLP